MLREQLLACRPRVKTRPRLLLQPVIPKPMHGVAPRVVLGSKWWDETRQQALASTDRYCAACGIHESCAEFHRRLEAHEVYRIDYRRGRMVYVEAVPLCHACHSYIHVGRLRGLLEAGAISHGRFTAIIQHGDRVLAAARIQKPEQYTGPAAGWRHWRLVVNGQEYPPKFKSAIEWETYHRGKGGLRNE